MTPDARSVAEKFGADRHRELLTILFTDLVDSTQLQSDLGNLEAARITELQRKLVRDELALYDAREIVWAGDSCLAVFAKPSDSPYPPARGIQRVAVALLFAGEYYYGPRCQLDISRV